MQIEIPDLDDDSQLKTPFGTSTLHHRTQSNSSSHLPFSASVLSFQSSASSTNLSNSRPFGGQLHQPPPSSRSASATPSVSSYSHDHHHDHHHHLQRQTGNLTNNSDQSLNLAVRRKPSLSRRPSLRSTPSSPSLNSSYHQAPVGLPVRRKLSVASLRFAINGKAAPNSDHSRSQQRNPNDQFLNSVPTNQIPSSPFSATPNPYPSSSFNGTSSRSQIDNITTHATSSASSNEHHSPLEVATYLITDRLFEECESKISQLLSKPISIPPEDEPYIPHCLGHGVDPAFDSTFLSLAQVSKKNPSQIVNLVMRWKSRQVEATDDYAIQRALATQGKSFNLRRITAVLSERKSIALVYLLYRALTAIVKVATRESLGEELGSHLEDLVFSSIKNADPYTTSKTPNKQANVNMLGYFLGALSQIRFTSVSDRAASEIDAMNKSALFRDQKDGEARLGNLIRSVQFLKLQVYPLEAFEDTADFIAAIASHFDASRGSLVKIAMAETLGPLLSQVVQTATAEVNHPSWGKSINMILNKAHSMSDKPSKSRYWNFTVPMMCAAVGAAPQDVLLTKWTEMVEWCMSRLKEKSTRATMTLGIVQLTWSYLHRVREGSSALNKRLEPILRNAFPSDRKNVYPSEVSLDTFASLIHFVLYWQLEYGTDFVLKTLLTYSNEAADANQALLAQTGAERIMIGIIGSLRALTSLEKGEDPVFPTNDNHCNLKNHSNPHAIYDNYIGACESSSDGHALKPQLLEKPRITALVDAIGTKVLQLATYCDHTLTSFTINNDKYVAPWHDSVASRIDVPDGPVVIKRHGAFVVEYPRHLQPTFDVLQTCLQAWPRILNSQASESAALAILLRGLISLDIDVTIQAKLCLRRFLQADKSFPVLEAYTRFLAKPDFLVRIKPHLQKGLDSKVENLIKFWVETLTAWCQYIRKVSVNSEDLENTISPSFGTEGTKLLSQVEATGLVLLCSKCFSIRRSALDALRIIATARSIIQEINSAATPKSVAFNLCTSVTSLMVVAESRLFDSLNVDDFSSLERPRLLKWKKLRKLESSESLTRLLETDNPADITLLCFALSSIFSTCLQHLPATVAHARILLYGQLQRLYPLASEAAGIGVRSTVNGTGLNPGWDDRNLYTSWSSLLISVTSITTSSDPLTGNLSPTIDTLSNTGHIASGRERNISPGEDLIKTLVPFLTSDQPPFREATIRAMSSIHVSMYPTLLEGLSGLAHHLASERKMVEAQNDRSAQSNGTVKIIRLFSAIGKLHESTTKLLFHSDFNATERTIDILLKFTRDTSIFLKSLQGIEDIVTISIRKSFLIFAERLLRKCSMLRSSSHLEQGLQVQISQLFSKDLIFYFYNFAEDWGGRSSNPSRTPSSPGNLNRDKSINIPGNKGYSAKSTSFSTRVGVAVKPKHLGHSNSHPGDLLHASARMIATLCESCIDIRGSSNSQRRADNGRDRPRISVSRILKWIVMLFEQNDSQSHAQARRAFIGSLTNSSDPDRFLEASLIICWSESQAMPLQQTLFGALGYGVEADPGLPIRETALLAICLARLTHSDLEVRQQAIDLLKTRGMLGAQLDLLSDLEVNLESAFSGEHLSAQFRTSAAICALQKVDPTEFVLELGSRIIQTDPQKSKLLSRLLPNWLTHIRLPNNAPDNNSPMYRNLINVIILVTSKIIDTYPDEVRSIWTSFASAAPPNAPVIIAYLVDQTARRGLPAFVGLVRILISCMSDDDATDEVFQDLLNLIEPIKLLAAPSAASSTDTGSSGSKAFDLETYYPALPPRSVFSLMQASILLLGETAVLRPFTLRDRLPHIIHAYVVQVDHTNLALKTQMQDGLLRYVGMLRRAGRSSSQLQSDSQDKSPQDSWKSFWEFDDLGGPRRHRKGPPTNMYLLVQEITCLSSHISPDFSRDWANVAVEWATQCPVRHIACRSLQVVRVLGLPIDPKLLAELLVRLSNTISDPSQDIQLFALEVLSTYSDCIKVSTGNPILPVQFFWTGVSCLETANDSEFLESIKLLQSVVNSVEPGYHYEIAKSRPGSWDSNANPFRPLLTKGLRSSQVCSASWSLVKELLNFPDNCGIADWLNGGLALLYAACLPWCLHILETGVMQYEMDAITLGVARLGELFRMDGISRVMMSFAKKRFRTKEDFLRQAVNGIREYFLPKFSADVLVVYLGLLCNPLEWLRLTTLSVLKLFLKALEPSASPEIFDLGIDLLSPLLNLLQTGVSPSALEILAEPLPCKVKPSNAKIPSSNDASAKKVFGIPDETGWCIPSLEEAKLSTRSKLTDVIDIFAASFISESLNRSSLVEFTYEWGHEADNSIDAQTQSDFAETNESFGDMVSTLHDLSDFFGQDGVNGANLGSSSRISSPLNPSTARVAAILSRSLSKRRANRPSLHVKPTGLSEAASHQTMLKNINHNSSSSIIGLSSSSRPLSVISSSGSSSISQPQPNASRGYLHKSSLSIDSKYDYLSGDELMNEDSTRGGDDEDEDDQSIAYQGRMNGAGGSLHGHTRLSSSENSSTDDSQSDFAFGLDDDHHSQ